MAGGGSFADLKVRVASAAVLVVVGVSAIWMGGYVFLGLVSLAAGVMLWELQRMLDAEQEALKVGLLAAVGAASVFRVGYDASALAVSSLFLAPVIGLVLLRQGRVLFLVYGTAILFTVAGLFWIRSGAGLGWTIWLVLVVIASDVGGYFFGRILGGPKILPVISPKKTWSGTVGGWALALCVGAGAIAFFNGNSPILLLSVATAIFAQIGDVVESAVKRHVGVKDASNIIPGHGGFLDRFDALIGASLFVMLYGMLIGLPGMLE